VLEGQQAIVGDRRDWLGDPRKWRTVEGVVTRPRAGDTIEWEFDDYTLVCECLPSDGEDVWQMADRYEKRMRVHTKVIERRPKE
jgi:hypothetical protein